MNKGIYLTEVAPSFDGREETRHHSGLFLPEPFNQALEAEKGGDLVRAMELHEAANSPWRAVELAMMLGRYEHAHNIYSRFRLYEEAEILVKAVVSGSGLPKKQPAYSRGGNFLTYDEFVPDFENRIPSILVQHHLRVWEEIRRIELIPDSIQRLISDEGGRGIFFHGKPTDTKEFANFSRDKADGIYDPIQRLFIAEPNEGTGFHEYAHMLDDIVGLKLFGMRLASLDAIENEYLFAKEHSLIDPKRIFNTFEFMAYAIELFYGAKSPPLNRRYLEDHYPATADVLHSIEDKV